MHLTKLLFLLLVLFAVACSGGAAPSARHAKTADSPPGAGADGAQGAPAAPLEATNAEGESAALDEAPAAPSAAGSASRAPRPAERRPGLGTTWGETRTSRVSTTPFIRDDSDSPFEVTRIFYDDAQGVRAMLRHSGFGSLRDDSFDVAGGALSVRLLTGSGRPLPGVSGEGRHFVAGDAGERYLIQIHNRTDERFEVVATVDGLDVVDGRAGGLHKRGYVIQPFATLEIDGFRQSFDSVAAFRFGAVDESYSARKGDARNVGVIGIAFFAEAGSEQPWLGRRRGDEARRRLEADAFPKRFAEPPRGF
jgi:hypothetical protein